MVSSKSSSNVTEQHPAHLVLNLEHQTSSQHASSSSAAAGLALVQQLIGMKADVLPEAALAVSASVWGSELAANNGLQPMPASATTADIAGAVIGMLRTAATEDASGMYTLTDQDPLLGWEGSQPASVAVGKGCSGWLSHVEEKQQVEWVPRLVPSALEQQLEWSRITPEPRSSLNNLVASPVDLKHVSRVYMVLAGMVCPQLQKRVAHSLVFKDHLASAFRYITRFNTSNCVTICNCLKSFSN
jgi:hypothetical protein